MGLSQGIKMRKKTPTIISSGQAIEDFDVHIKVSAGRERQDDLACRSHLHVARKSRRLHKAAKILCISYTNAASEAIRGKLGVCADIVETSTIHSFLFNNVVRPYLHMLTDEKWAMHSRAHVVHNHYEPTATTGEWMNG